MLSPTREMQRDIEEDMTTYRNLFIYRFTFLVVIISKTSLVHGMYNYIHTETACDLHVQLLLLAMLLLIVISQKWHFMVLIKTGQFSVIDIKHSPSNNMQIRINY